MAVGIVHSVKVAVVAIANTDPAGKSAGRTSMRDRTRTAVPLTFNFLTTWGGLMVSDFKSRTI